MSACAGGRPCKWCGTGLPADTAEFCATCQAPQTNVASLLYITNFIAKNLAIPLAIGIVTLILSNRQQEIALITANRQKLAEALGEVGKIQADSRLAYTQVAFMALPNGTTVPAKDLKDAATRLDVAINSFGPKLGPFEEFVRRTNYYNIEPRKASPLQKAWDMCFVIPYYGEDGKKPGYLQLVEKSLTKCDEAVCPKSVAQELKNIHDDFYKGYCSDLRDKSGKLVKSLPLIWFNRELKRIFIQQPRGNEDLYILGEE